MMATALAQLTPEAVELGKEALKVGGPTAVILLALWASLRTLTLELRLLVERMSKVETKVAVIMDRQSSRYGDGPRDSDGARDANP